MSSRCAYVVGLFLLIGCGRAEVDSQPASFSEEGTTPVAFQESDDPTQAVIDETETATSKIAPSDRKVIHHAQVRIDVSDFGSAAHHVESLISQHNGFVASSELGGRSGSQRSGHWTLRVPVEQYRSLIAALTELGELQQQRETSEEVTAEYFDLEARVRNKQQEETRLLNHLNETTRGLPEILTIEKEISRVRSEVERLQGRLKMLASQTSLSTIELTITEKTPLVIAETPPFVARWRQTWSGSVELLLSFLQWITLVATAMLPWAVTLAVILLILLTFNHLLQRWLRASPQ